MKRVPREQGHTLIANSMLNIVKLLLIFLLASQCVLCAIIHSLHWLGGCN